MVLNGSTRESTSKLSPPLLFSLLTAISLLVWWSPLTSSLALAVRDSQVTHILLILPVSVSLIYLEWNGSESFADPHSSIGFLLLVGAVAATIAAKFHTLPLRPDEQLSVNMLALVVWWIGAFIVF